MTVQRNRGEPPLRPGRDDWERPVYDADESPVRGAGVYATALLVLAALAVLCLAGFLLVRLLRPSTPALLPGSGSPTPLLTAAAQSQPTVVLTPGQLQVAISPAEGYINTLVTVVGGGYWSGEAVFIFLRSPQEAEGHGFSYAAAVADEDGSIRTAFTFPNEQRWIGQAWAEVIARGSRSSREATTRLTLIAPTATPTLPVPTLPPYTPPTATSTRPTDTPSPRPTDTPAATATPTALVITDWRGEYFANPALAGTPVLVRNDVDIKFGWGASAPATGLPVDGFSARWTRARHFRSALYRFTATVDDGVRLYVDDRLLIDEWHSASSATYTADVLLAEGTHALRVEYYEDVGGAAIQLDWQRIDAPTATPTPTVTPATSTPTPTPTGVVITDWRGEYFTNPSLAGDPVLVRNDFYVDFNWGVDAPGPGVPADNFSVRWTRSREFRDAAYHFTITVDDGVRFYIDDQIVIDEWHPASGATYAVNVHLTEGTHVMRIEYYDGVAEAMIQFGWTRQ